MGKFFLYGIWKDIVRVVFRVKDLWVEMFKFFLKEVVKECIGIVLCKKFFFLRKILVVDMKELFF